MDGLIKIYRRWKSWFVQREIQRQIRIEEERSREKLREESVWLPDSIEQIMRPITLQDILESDILYRSLMIREHKPFHPPAGHFEQWEGTILASLKPDGV